MGTLFRALNWIGMLLLLAVSAEVRAQNPSDSKLVFETVPDIPGGTRIVQDRDGVMWFGANDGVYRYDGYEVTPYLTVEGDPTSMPSYMLGDLMADRDGFIWVGSYGLAADDAVHRLDPSTGRFTPFPELGYGGGGLFQDRDGKIWSARRGGIVRYDPETDAATFFEADPERPGAAPVWTLQQTHQDRSGTLWFNAEGHLYRFDAERETFDEIDLAAIGDSNSLRILEDSKGRFWLQSDAGLFQFDRSSGRFDRIPVVPPGSPLFGLWEDRNAGIWLSSSGKLHRFDPESGHIEAFEGNHAWGGATALDGSVWIATNFATYRVPAAQFGVHNRRLDFGQDGVQTQTVLAAIDGAAWLGTTAGLFRIRDADSVLPEPIAGIQGVIIDALLRDRSGRLWVGTRGRGLARLDDAAERITWYRHSEQASPSLTDDYILSLFEDRHGELWVITNGGGLNRYDRNADTFHPVFVPLRYHPGWFALLDSLDAAWRSLVDLAGEETARPARWEASRLLQEGESKMVTFSLGEETPVLISMQTWLFQDGREVGKTEIRTVQGEMVWSGGTHFHGTPAGSFGDVGLHLFVDTLQAGTYEALCSRAEGLQYGYGSWFGFPVDRPDRFGLEIFDLRGMPRPRLADPVRNGPTSGIEGDGVRSIHEDAAGNLWVATESGFHLYDRRRGVFVRSTTLPPLPIRQISGITVDSAGGWWIPTGGNRRVGDGLYRLDPQTSKTEVIPIRQHAGKIVVDGNARLWASGQSIGLINAGFGTVRSFGPEDGYDAEELGPVRFATPGPDGRLYLARDKGITIIDPDVMATSIGPHMILTDILLFGERVEAGPDAPIDVPVGRAEDIRLRYNQNDITLRYTGVGYVRTRDTRHSYRLLPYDEDWRDAGTNREATYTNLPFGSYEFQVRAMNAEGTPSENTATIRIEITAPWWRTFWAYGFYLILLASGAFGAFRLQRDRIQRREREQARERELEQARRIERAYHDLEETHGRLKTAQRQLVQSEKMASLGQLTAGIAHEIQNPLNFVNNFAGVNHELLEDLLGRVRSGEVSSVDEVADDLTTVRGNEVQIVKHGKRADAIVKSMMEHAGVGAGERYEVGLNAFLNEYIDIAYSGLRSRIPTLKVSIERDLDPSIGMVRMSPREMGRALVNLLNNALEAASDRQRAGRLERMRGTSPPSAEQGGIPPPSPYGEPFPTDEPPHDAEKEPRVRIESRKMAGVVEIRILDNGPGIPADIRERIFEPFFTTKPAGTAVGLGLSLAYEIIVEGHGGTLTVESEEGRGAMFVIGLPVGETGE